MLLEKERTLVMEYGQKLIVNQLTTGTGGNLSIFNREKQLVAISPSGMNYFDITPEDVVVIDLNGNVVDGNRTPSSEVSMHLIYYNKRDDIQAVVHTHSNYATTISCMNWELPAVHYLVAFAGNNVRCAKYATYGSPELAVNSFEAMRDRRAVLLANHGLLAGGNDIDHAFNIAEEIEFCAELYYRTKSIGEPVILGENEMTLMQKKFETYGQRVR
ncbi:L-fuculose-phosphate aldolase [Sporosarcina thermotolerans]|uniref:L-fuculose-phosphate aldolase n=1 Tax=Sporosarcina thermotolerans TaxID=633404 RepID=A0AAW9AAH4_9BACL|nr:L-fuculose-phosphate aldolase [Sporosarcina thermotolerans]MDW0116133.1 L-fuculose-phosphate aldolase [Sporosarcina thermotolerans]WHT48103.1 L-fuculose-phosphate aldolase [Sporosarcina thermotolerans]